MKRRIIALILVMGLLAGMGVDGKKALAADSTPAGQTKEIAKIEVVDTEIELPYKSTFTKENVVIKVTYEDATEQLVHPEKMTAVDTTKIGEQQLELSYQDKTINYTVRIVPRQVTGLKRKETTKKKAVIEWNALAESAEYEIFTSSKETSAFSLLKSTTKTSYEFTNLKEGQILYVKIRAGANGYYGKEIIEIASKLYEEYKDTLLNNDLDYFKKLGTNEMVGHIFDDLKEYRIEYDVKTSEKALSEKYDLMGVVNILNKNGYTYELDGATWFKCSALFDDKDHVLIKEDGIPTYFLPDIAYHMDKFNRGFDKMIDIFGADHHGYVARLKSSVKALGNDPEKLEVKLLQLVRLVENGEVVKMSKRTGKSVTLKELIDEVWTYEPDMKILKNLKNILQLMTIHHIMF